MSVKRLRLFCPPLFEHETEGGGGGLPCGAWELSSFARDAGISFFGRVAEKERDTGKESERASERERERERERESEEFIDNQIDHRSSVSTRPLAGDTASGRS